MNSHCVNTRCLLTVLATSVLFGIASYHYVQSHHKYIYRERRVQERLYTNQNVMNKDVINVLDGCYHVYLDVGSNIGVQIRKLYEPEKYPNAKVHSVFNTQFGPVNLRKRKVSESICAVGFEPNNHHTKYLKEIEESYNKCNWRVKFFTETAVSDHNGETQFYTDEDVQNLEWGGGILPPDVNSIAVGSSKGKNKFPMNVTLVRLSEFLKNVVGGRKIPNIDSESPPNVVMKIDIEGSEVDVIPDLIFTGGLQYINSLMVEWHERFQKLNERRKAETHLKNVIKDLSIFSNNMKGHGGKFDFSLLNLDDETYYRSRFDLPRC